VASSPIASTTQNRRSEGIFGLGPFQSPDVNPGDGVRSAGDLLREGVARSQLGTHVTRSCVDPERSGPADGWVRLLPGAAFVS
jgi:hypothetical protein